LAAIRVHCRLRRLGAVHLHRHFAEGFHTDGRLVTAHVRLRVIDGRRDCACRQCQYKYQCQYREFFHYSLSLVFSACYGLGSLRFRSRFRDFSFCYYQSGAHADIDSDRLVC